jgi:hypothetical protein
MSMQTLSDVFGDRINSSGIWPAPRDIFFWDYLKGRVYNSNSRTEELKVIIPAEQL